MIGSPESFPAAPDTRRRAQSVLGAHRPDRRGPDRVQADTSLAISRITIAKDLYADSLFEPITYTFQYFVAIALLTGLVVAVGLLLYLESRTVPHRRAYIMLRRMGLRPRTHRAALLWELSIALGSWRGGGRRRPSAVIGVALRGVVRHQPGRRRRAPSWRSRAPAVLRS